MNLLGNKILDSKYKTKTSKKLSGLIHIKVTAPFLRRF